MFNNEFYLKTKYLIGKFVLYLKKEIPRYKTDLSKITNANQLNEFYEKFLDRVHKCAIKNIRKKKKISAKFVWWTRELASYRNKVTAFYKKLKYAILRKDPQWVVQILRISLFGIH